MRLSFSKMHGLGNDFVLLDGISSPIELSSDSISRLGHRRLGVGFDQLLLAVPDAQASSGVGVKIYNADGSAAEQCGNGMRCFARFAHRRGLLGEHLAEVMSPGGLVALQLLDGGRVQVGMGEPVLNPDEIPFQATPGERSPRAPTYAIEVEGGKMEIGAVSMGNPHAVVGVGSVEDAPVTVMGPLIQTSPCFPQGVNVGFREVLGRSRIRLRVYERGVGETLACGSGACAAVVAGIEQGLLDSLVTVELPGGRLGVEWQGAGAQVWMTGPTEQVFEGEVDVEF